MATFGTDRARKVSQQVVAMQTPCAIEQHGPPRVRRLIHLGHARTLPAKVPRAKLVPVAVCQVGLGTVLVAGPGMAQPLARAARESGHVVDGRAYQEMAYQWAASLTSRRHMWFGGSRE